MGWLDIFRAKPMPEQTQGATLDRVILHVTWGKPEDKSLRGVTKGPMWFEDGDYHAYVTCPKPQDFNDSQALETLGHECYHALGARHD